MKKNITYKTVALSIIVSIVSAVMPACSGISGKTRRSPTLSTTATSAANTKQNQAPNSESKPKSPIRQVDFKNFTYPKLPTGKCSAYEVHLANGKYEAPEGIAGKIPSIDCWSVALGPVTYADVTGDGEEEAIVELYAESGGTESSEDVYIYRLQGGTPFLLWKFATGDRADGGRRRIYSENGELVVELFGVGTAPGKKLYGTEEVGAATPEHYTRTKYKWAENHFQQDGEPEIFPNPGRSANPVSPPTPSS